jgi:hypothetical protein
MPFSVNPAAQTGQLSLLQIKLNPAATTTISKPIVLQATLLTLVDKVLVTNSNGYVTASKAPENITLEDITSTTGNIRAFGLNSSGTVTCGIIFIPKESLDIRDAQIFPEGVVEVHTKTSTAPSVSYP